MAADRAQDTEAIRAAPPVEGDVPAQWYLDMRAERDRLVARLEAAEQVDAAARVVVEEWHAENPFVGISVEVLEDALAAAAPGETEQTP